MREELMSRLQKKAQEKIKSQIANRQQVTPQEAMAKIAALTKRRDSMVNFEVKKDYRVLYNDDNAEIREYQPHRRTIVVSSRDEDRDGNTIYKKSNFFLPMPYCIFAHRKKHPEGIEKIRTDDRGRETNLSYKGFYLGFSKKPIESSLDRIYMPFLPNMYEDYKICEGSAGGHTFDHRVTNYWNSEFLPHETPHGAHAVSYAVRIAAARYNECFEAWSKLTPEDVMNLMEYASCPIEDTKFGNGVHFGYDRDEYVKIQQEKAAEARKEQLEAMRARRVRQREMEALRNDNDEWVACPNCDYEFIVGDVVDDIECPACNSVFWGEDYLL